MLKGALAGATALSFKEGPLEENKVADSYRDASICKVEDWAEKDKVLPPPQIGTQEGSCVSMIGK